MSTKQVADRFYELAKENRYDAIQNELYATNAVSIDHLVPLRRDYTMQMAWTQLRTKVMNSTTW